MNNLLTLNTEYLTYGYYIIINYDLHCKSMWTYTYESLHVKLNPNTVNLKEDTENINNYCNNLILLHSTNNNTFENNQKNSPSSIFIHN